MPGRLGSGKTARKSTTHALLGQYLVSGDRRALVSGNTLLPIDEPRGGRPRSQRTSTPITAANCSQLRCRNNGDKHLATAGADKGQTLAMLIVFVAPRTTTATAHWPQLAIAGPLLFAICARPEFGEKQFLVVRWKWRAGLAACAACAADGRCLRLNASLVVLGGQHVGIRTRATSCAACRSEGFGHAAKACILPRCMWQISLCQGWVWTGREDLACSQISDARIS
jgi:hypothetical protein